MLNWHEMTQVSPGAKQVWLPTLQDCPEDPTVQVPPPVGHRPGATTDAIVKMSGPVASQRDAF